MRLSRDCFALILGVAAIGFLPAKDFWEQPFQKWNRGQVVKMLSDSAWAQSYTMTREFASKGSGEAGEKELFYKFTVRFFSAQPIREAYVRMVQIMNNYDDMGPEQKQEFEAKFHRALALDVHDRVIVALDYGSNDPMAARDLATFFETAKTDLLNQQVYLISQRLGRVQLLEYYPPSKDGTGAKFIFPRTVKGEPVVAPDDKEVRFDFWVPVVNQRLFVTFKPARMTYHDSLVY